MYKENAKKLLAFIEKSPSPFHVIRNMTRELELEGFQKLVEKEAWNLEEGGKYYVTRNDSSLIAFKIPTRDFGGFQIMASHSDAPTFKVKEHAEIEAEHSYIKLNVEKYGGMLCAPWFDRPLSVTGRLLVKENDRLVSKLVCVDHDLLMIPNLAIHMNREANEGYKFNPQVDLLPILGDETAHGKFQKIVADAAGVEEENIVGNDLFLYNRQRGVIWGADEVFLSSAKLDDLECAYASLQGVITGENEENVCVHCVFDNEEVGSGTKQGAASTFLKDTLMRINRGMGRSEEEYYMALAGSFMISADNAHGVHPNKGEKADPTNRPRLNGGIVIKHSANQKYTTDAVSAAVLKLLCEKADVPVQTYFNRSDMLGGSTLGNISNTQVAVNTVDIGVAQLAMHSPYETAGVRDVTYLMKMAKTFFDSTICIDGRGSIEIK